MLVSRPARRTYLPEGHAARDDKGDDGADGNTGRPRPSHVQITFTDHGAALGLRSGLRVATRGVNKNNSRNQVTGWSRENAN